MKKFLQFLICLILFNKAFLVIGQTWNITVIFPYFKDSVSDVRVCYGSTWGSDGKIMTKQSDGSYTYTINDNFSNSLLFDIYYIPPKNSCLKGQPDYIPGNSGIKYSYVYVNDTRLNNSFLVYGGWTSLDGCQRNMNFKIHRNIDGSITPDYTEVKRAFVDERIQPEVHYMNYCNHNKIPPSITDCKCIKPWFQALHDYRYPDSVSKIEIDYFELYYRNGSEKKLLIREDYSDGFDQTNEGGLYSRYPFLSSCNDGHSQIPATCPNDILTFYPSDNKDKLYHFWLQPGINRVPQDRYYIIAKVKITGPASIQAGIDFTPDSISAINHDEIGVSNWYFESSGWQYLIFDLENNLPIANAGLDQSVNEGATVTLDGSASSDPDGSTITYKWTAPTGITLSSTTTAKPTFTAPEVSANTNYTFSLVVNDGAVDSQVDQVVITVKNVNKSPVANAGIDQSINEGTIVSLDGSASSDPDGSTITYKWTAPTGIILSSTTIAKPTFTAPEVSANTNYTFSLVVNDGTVDSPVDQVVITVKNVNKAPVANAGPDQSVNESATVTLDGSASSDPDGNPLTYKWTAPAGIALSSTTAAKPTFTAQEVSVNTNYTFSLVVNDGTVDSPVDQVVITVKNINKSPVANAGNDQTVKEGATVSLDGSGSSDSDLDNLIYNWTAPAKVLLSDSKSVKPSFVAPEVKKDSMLSISLVVNDGKVNSSPSTVKVTVLNVVKVGNLEISFPGFKIYPNPTTGITTIEFSQNRGKETTVSVLNMLGAQIFRKELKEETKLQIDLSNQISGIFMLKVTTDNQQYISKIVLRK